MEQALLELWPHLGAAIGLVLAVVGSAHAVLHKRDTRAAALWVGLIWLVPLIGTILYATLGVNRIRRRALALRRDRREALDAAAVLAKLPRCDDRHPMVGPLAELFRLTARITRLPILDGNRVEPLVAGDAAYPAMLAAINSAERTIALCTYIFDNDVVGRRFAAALGEAVKRGVEVCVLIDDVGTLYTRPSITRELEAHGVPYALFLPAAPWRAPVLNLRNHRKVMVVDGATGFAGGMNIRRGHALRDDPPDPIDDVHFRFEGPIVAELLAVFAEDWQFTKGEALRGPGWWPALAPTGHVLARAITDGPDEDFDKLYWTIMGAIGSARRRVRVVTPYFLPGQAVLGALVVAALRGVEVELVVPARTNIVLVHWAMRDELRQLLPHGVRIYESPAPFDHTKLMVVDDQWALVGSGNWDARSLRLNFELNVECYSPALAAQINRLIDERIARSRPLDPAVLLARSLPVRVRDAAARLLSPYL